MYNKIKIKVYETVVNEQSTSRASKIFSSIIYASIFYMLLLFIIGTDTIIREKYNTFFKLLKFKYRAVYNVALKLDQISKQQAKTIEGVVNNN